MNKILSILVAGSSIAATAAGMYGVVAVSATSIASSFTTQETIRHTRVVEFETMLKQASDGHTLARTKCERLDGTKKRLCNAAARAQEKRALRNASAAQGSPDDPASMW